MNIIIMQQMQITATATPEAEGRGCQFFLEFVINW
jgi:hypothetical protein